MLMFPLKYPTITMLLPSLIERATRLNKVFFILTDDLLNYCYQITDKTNPI